MALTETEKAEIRCLLGYTDRDRGLYNSIEGAFLALSAEGEVIVRDILTKIAAIDTALAGNIDKQGVKRVEDVHFRDGFEGTSNLWREGNRCVKKLAAFLGVPVQSWPYSDGPGITAAFARG